MSIQIPLTPEEEKALAELARARGKDPADHAHDVVVAYLRGVCGARARTEPSTLEEILAPIWEGWDLSGMTEDEIETLFKRELREARGERRQRQGTP